MNNAKGPQAVQEQRKKEPVGERLEHEERKMEADASRAFQL
jgi:hypothetical protein